MVYAKFSVAYAEIAKKTSAACMSLIHEVTSQIRIIDQCFHFKSAHICLIVNVDILCAVFWKPSNEGIWIFAKSKA